jgi:hypothetical protein
MPLSINPAIRMLQAAMESAGLIPTLNSDAFNQQAAAEVAGTTPVILPVGWNIIIDDITYSGNTLPASGDPDANMGEEIPVVSGGDSA